MARRITDSDLQRALEEFCHATRGRVDDYNRAKDGYSLSYAYGEVALVYRAAGGTSESTIFGRDSKRAIYNQLRAAATGAHLFIRNMQYPGSPLEEFVL